MVLASVTGAIDYTTDDGSTLFKIRESALLNVLDSKRRADWYYAKSMRHAILSRGTSWLTNESAAEVSKLQLEAMNADELSILEDVFPYQTVNKAVSTVTGKAEEMSEAFERIFGGDPSSEVARKTIQELKDKRLPKNQKVENLDMTAVSKFNKSWVAKMKPIKRK